MPTLDAVRDSQIPTEEEAAEASQALDALAEFLQAHPTPSGRVRIFPEDAEGSPATEVVVPTEAFRLLIDILAQMAEGNIATVIPINAELTTQQAADLLNVSRPFLVKLVETGKIPHRKVGNRRRIRFADLSDYKRRDDAERRRVADELTAEAETLGLGYH